MQDQPGSGYINTLGSVLNGGTRDPCVGRMGVRLSPAIGTLAAYLILALSPAPGAAGPGMCRRGHSDVRRARFGLRRPDLARAPP